MTKKELQAELKKIKADMIEAAGELLIDVPEPGSDMAKLLHANVMMSKYRIPGLEEKTRVQEGEIKRLERNAEHMDHHNKERQASYSRLQKESTRLHWKSIRDDHKIDQLKKDTKLLDKEYKILDEASTFLRLDHEEFFLYTKKYLKLDYGTTPLNILCCAMDRLKKRIKELEDTEKRRLEALPTVTALEEK